MPKWLKNFISVVAKSLLIPKLFFISDAVLLDSASGYLFADIKLKDWQKAITDCNTVLNTNGNDTKGTLFCSLLFIVLYLFSESEIKYYYLAYVINFYYESHSNVPS